MVVDAGKRMPPSAPAELSDAQAQIWRDVVGSLPGGWISRAVHPVLVAYCRHVCRARLLEQQIAMFEMTLTKAQGRLDRLLAMAERETRAVTACARALRLTPQAQMHPRTAGRQLNDMPTMPRPWD